jgi:hypothetical protein
MELSGVQTQKRRNGSLVEGEGNTKWIIKDAEMEIQLQDRFEFIPIIFLI